MTTLTKLANKYNSDKGTIHREAHAYSIIYDLLFKMRSSEQLTIAEFGLQTGGPELLGSEDRVTTDIPSAKMWMEYFPKTMVYGFDISDFSKFEAGAFKFMRVDCGDEEALTRTVKDAPMFDIIIDDASHASFHQQLTFIKLFPKLKPGGIYIIEDLHWQPPALEAELPKTVLTRHLFENLDAADSSILAQRVCGFRREIGDVQLYSTDTLRALRKEYNLRNCVEPHQDDVQSSLPLWRLRRQKQKVKSIHGERAASSEAKLLVLQKMVEC